MDYEKILSSFLDSKGRVTAYPVKRKMKIYVLLYLFRNFEKGRNYSESDVNDIIDTHTLFNDSATIRRELCGYGLLERKLDCSSYWVPENTPLPEELLK